LETPFYQSTKREQPDSTHLFQGRELVLDVLHVVVVVMVDIVLVVLTARIADILGEFQLLGLPEIAVLLILNMNTSNTF